MRNDFHCRVNHASNTILINVYSNLQPTMPNDKDFFCCLNILLRIFLFPFSSVQLLSCVWLFVTPWTAALQASLSITNSQSLLKFMSLSRWCHPTISSSVVPFSSHLQSFPASGSFSNESGLLIRWPKYWSFSFSISPSNEYSGLISFRMD